MNLGWMNDWMNLEKILICNSPFKLIFHVRLLMGHAVCTAYYPDKYLLT